MGVEFRLEVLNSRGSGFRAKGASCFEFRRFCFIVLSPYRSPGHTREDMGLSELLADYDRNSGFGVV